MESKTKQNNKELLLGTIIYGIGNFGTKFLSFLIVPLYTYFISPGDLGDYDLLMTTVSLMSPLLTMKISDATYRWIIRSTNVEEKEDSIAATYQLLFRNCILCAIILLTINLFVPIWNCYYFIAILVGDRVLECIQKLLRGVKSQKLFALSGVFYTSVMVTSNLIKVCILKQGVTALLQSAITAQILTIALILLLEKRIRVLKIRKNYSALQRQMLAYSIPLVPSTLSWWVISASDRYVIRLFLGKVANGIFSVAHKFPSILQIMFTMFNNAWTDMALAQLRKGEATQKYSSDIFEQLYRISFCASFILIPGTKLLTQLILNDAYKEASVYMGFLYLGTVFQGFSSFCSIGYLQDKKTKGAATTSMYGAAVNLIIDIILMRFIGLHAAALSTFAGFFVMWITRMRDIRDIFPITVNKAKFTVYTSAAVMLSIITIWSNRILDTVLLFAAIIIFILLNRAIIESIIMSVYRKIRR